MTLNGWLQIAVYCAIVTGLSVPLGIYMARVFTGERTWLTPVFAPLERVIYRLCGVDPQSEQHWTGYAVALLAFSAVGYVLLFSVLVFQHLLPLNPQQFAGVAPDLAFGTTLSFVTNTNWQAYGGESTLSYLSQMLGLAVQNFVSAAAGIAVAIAVIRGFARRNARSIGNFWVDLTRATLYLLLPLSLVAALVFVWQGVPQNFLPYVEAQTLEGGKQLIAQGPVASQIAIKQIGSNGGGFFNANSAHPYENPTVLTNLIESVFLILIAAGLTHTFGRMVGQPRQGWALFGAMGLLLLAGFALTYWAESRPTPALAAAGVEAGNLEGKETRFGIASSTIWAVATTAASNGSVNSMHDSYTPLGGLVPIANMMTGEVIFGGVGAGLYGMFMYAIVAVFIAGLMVGRTPEYLGKKIEAYEVKMAALALLITPLLILGFTALACVLPAGLKGVQDAGPHGFSEILYAFSSASANNGSAFAGLTANSWFYNLTQGFAMLFGRFAMIIPLLALAGSLAAKKTVPASPGTFPTDRALFVGLLVSVILIVGGLTFFPALALGPIVEELAMRAGESF